MDDLIDRIQAIRSANNSNWMDLLRLALEAEPDKAKRILLRISLCDAEIRDLTKQLSED